MHWALLATVPELQNKQTTTVTKVTVEAKSSNIKKQTHTMPNIEPDGYYMIQSCKEATDPQGAAAIENALFYNDVQEGQWKDRASLFLHLDPGLNERMVTLFVQA